MNANPSEVPGPAGRTEGQEQTDDQRQAALANGASHDSRVSENHGGRRVPRAHARSECRACGAVCDASQHDIERHVT